MQIRLNTADGADVTNPTDEVLAYLETLPVHKLPGAVDGVGPEYVIAKMSDVHWTISPGAAEAIKQQGLL